ncbi:flagellar motor switch protein FliG [Halotalea alkalilenta]|uniref:flagellar motor switch protein FliG n=1 Tax=Halotalea alkalilenta TaxID=376489 RepID=UPI0004883A8B|nr:flagellar motor switch protein FliG [Halotalea alkalilenta]
MTSANVEFNLTAGLERSAILMLALEEETAVHVFKHLNMHDVQRLSRAMASLGPLSNERVTEVMNDFDDELDQFSAINIDSTEHLKGILTKTLGEDRATELLSDILEASNSTGLDSLNGMEAKVIAELIRDEHPQIIATIIVHLERGHAANVLNLLDDDQRSDILLRIATFGGVQPAALAELDQVLGGMLSGKQVKRDKLGGVRPAAEILNLMSSSFEEQVISRVRAYDEELAQQIVDQMFVFDNLIDLDGQAIQRIIQEVDSNSLAIALKGTDEALREHFFSFMSNRAAEILRDDIQMRGPIRVTLVEAEQKAITQLARRLAERGEINLGHSEEDYV